MKNLKINLIFLIKRKKLRHKVKKLRDKNFFFPKQSHTHTHTHTHTHIYIFEREFYAQSHFVLIMYRLLSL